jgi:hypothetical protein
VGFEKLQYGRGVEVEHLGAGKFGVADLVEPEDLAIETLAVGVDPALTPQNDDLLVVCRNHARVHASFLVRGFPDLFPALPWTSGQERRRPVELDLGVIERFEAVAVALRDGGECVEHDAGGAVGAILRCLTLGAGCDCGFDVT